MLTTVARVLAEDKSSDTPPGTYAPAPPTANQTAAVLTAIQKVTARIRRMSFNFEPTFGTEYFTTSADNSNVGRGILTLKNAKLEQLHLLASTADPPVIFNNTQALTFAMIQDGAANVLPYPQNSTPIRQLRLNDATPAIYMTWYPSILPWYDNISVQGWWGYNRNFANAWVDSLDTVQDAAGLVAGTRLITVSSVTGLDARFNAPRFSPGNLIRINNELFLVMTTDGLANTLGVQPAQNGTTAATHAKNATISIWYPEQDVIDTVSTQAAYFYAKRGAYEEVSIQGITAIKYPPDMVGELLAMLQGYNFD